VTEVVILVGLNFGAMKKLITIAVLMLQKWYW